MPGRPVSATTQRTGVWERDFPRFTPDQLFALVSDIEKYPQFVPGCIATRIVERRDRSWRVHNVFGLGPVDSRFFTLAAFDAPTRLDITSHDGPWRNFHLAWRFDPVGQGCHVTCRFSVKLRSRVLSALAALAMPEAERLIIGAFEARAHALYDPPSAQAPGLISPRSPTS